MPNKAFSFGINREAYRKVYFKGNYIRDPTIPGPGAYTINSLVGNEGRKFTLKSKAKNLSTYHKYNVGFVDLRYKSPGPCAYKAPPAISPDGKFPYSNYKSSCCGVFNPPKSKRFFSKLSLYSIAPARDIVPGPGQYKEKNMLADKGHYILSTIAGPQTQRFAKGPKGKSVNSLKSVPGPGTYRAISEFGYYESLPYANNKSRNNGTSSRTTK